MQTRRVFLFDGLINLAVFATSGGLVMVGKEKVEKIIQPQKQDADTPGLPANTINHATDFALGGVLGIALRKVIEKSINLNRLNKELSSVVSKLQQLENNDLVGIERTLQAFVHGKGIKYEVNKDSNIVESIQGLVGAILIHVDSHNKAVQPFLEELQKLRNAVAQPFIEQLQSGGEVNTATKEAVIQVLRSKKLTEYLETIIVNALNKSGAGEEISKNTVNSIAKKDLISTDGDIALKQTITKILSSDQFREALAYTTCNAVTEYDIVDKLAEALSDEFRICLKNNDLGLTALKNALSDALSHNTVSERLVKELIVSLQRALDKSSGQKA